MAGRRTYTDSDRAQVRVQLEVNDGNIRRTARDTGIPIQTIRDWRDLWEKEGVPREIEEITFNLATDYISSAELLRDKVVRELHIRVDSGDASTKDLSVLFGILEDKIVRAKGLATKRVETVVTMPDMRALGENLASFLTGALDAAKQRHGEIVEGEIIEQAPRALESAPQQED